MATAPDEAASILNNLIDVNKDSALLFHAAAETIDRAAQSYARRERPGKPHLAFA